jgi:hypothetical protein
MAYPDKYGLTLEPTKTKLELAVLEGTSPCCGELSATYSGYGLSWRRRASETMRKQGNGRKRMSLTGSGTAAYPLQPLEI